MNRSRHTQGKSIEERDIDRLLASCKCAVTGNLVEQRVRAALTMGYRLGWARHADAVAGIFDQTRKLACPVEPEDRGDMTDSEKAKIRDEVLNREERS
ncbi:hypothetical protein [Trinickia mobilis]|uniref:hypothetical protein n=1 Tax=Trinickia mobilis TaxID=2816356 RepID=UPI001A8E6AEC|nr:hypothetical protein [Trinickia mobilis]